MGYVGYVDVVWFVLCGVLLSFDYVDDVCNVDNIDNIGGIDDVDCLIFLGGRGSIVLTFCILIFE